MARPVVLIHGYSDQGESFFRWRSALEAAGHDVASIHTCSYETLTNEVSIRDVAEGLDRALKHRAGIDASEDFDAIVHSTGMLVLRAWLTAYERRRSRLKHLIGLAPASFGSPLAHKGRSWLGSIFKGNKKVGPDFMEAGDCVLDGLELASRFTWDLAHQDMIGQTAVYGSGPDTPFVFTFCGAEGYTGFRKLISEKGTDGTVRWAGCALNTRKVTLDLTIQPDDTGHQRYTIAPWSNTGIPLVPVPGLNHASILNEPTDELIAAVTGALRVESADELAAWYASDPVEGWLGSADDLVGRWQQFVVRAVDERGDPIADYNLELFTRAADRTPTTIEDFDLDVHPYSTDPSFRCFHVDLNALAYESLPNLWMRIIASSGSTLVGYHGHSTPLDRTPDDAESTWTAEMNLSDLLGLADVKFFYPNTTTLIEIRLNREPLPIEGDNRLVKWV